MAKRQELMCVEVVTDCDTGIYNIGEIDFGIKVGPLTDYLKRYGYQGKREIIATLGFLIHKVEEYHAENVQATSAESQGSSQ